MENQIREKALELGYENCGIIKVSALAGYLEKLEERITRIPKGEQQYGAMRNYADPSAANPAIKSIVVATAPTYKYNVPEEFKKSYGKACLFDNRVDENAPFFHIRKTFATFMESLGLTCTWKNGYGIPAPARWSAYQAGLGIIRHNNFFYGENGSNLLIEMFGIDQELELIGNVTLKECPEKCGKCIKACPTHTLTAPYTMSMHGCVSFQNSMFMGTPSPEMAEQTGNWLYGCDACQDACPFNKDKCTGGEDFPGLDTLAPAMRPENIMKMSYSELEDSLVPKYWYIKSKNLWKWKLNALTAMMNAYSDKYEDAIKLGLNDPNESVRDFSRNVCVKVGISH